MSLHTVDIPSAWKLRRNDVKSKRPTKPSESHKKNDRSKTAGFNPTIPGYMASTTAKRDKDRPKFEFQDFPLKPKKNNVNCVPQSGTAPPDKTRKASDLDKPGYMRLTSACDDKRRCKSAPATSKWLPGGRHVVHNRKNLSASISPTRRLSGVSSSASSMRKSTCSASKDMSGPRYLAATSAALMKSRNKVSSPSVQPMKCGSPTKNRNRQNVQQTKQSLPPRPIQKLSSKGKSYMSLTTIAKIKADGKPVTHNFLRRGSGKGAPIASPGSSHNAHSKSLFSVPNKNASNEEPDGVQRASVSVPEIRNERTLQTTHSKAEMRSASTQAIIDACQTIPEKIVINSEAGSSVTSDTGNYSSTDINLTKDKINWSEERTVQSTGNCESDLLIGCTTEANIGCFNETGKRTTTDNGLYESRDVEHISRILNHEDHTGTNNQRDISASENKDNSQEELIEVELHKSEPQCDLLLQAALQNADVQTQESDDFVGIIEERLAYSCKLAKPKLETIEEEHSSAMNSEQPQKQDYHIDIIVYDEDNKILYDSRTDPSDDFTKPQAIKSTNDSSERVRINHGINSFLPVNSNIEKDATKLSPPISEVSGNVKANIYHIDLMMQQIPDGESKISEAADTARNVQTPAVADGESLSVSKRASVIVDYVLKRVSESLCVENKSAVECYPVDEEGEVSPTDKASTEQMEKQHKEERHELLDEGLGDRTKDGKNVTATTEPDDGSGGNPDLGAEMEQLLFGTACANTDTGTLGIDKELPEHSEAHGDTFRDDNGNQASKTERTKKQVECNQETDSTSSYDDPRKAGITVMSTSADSRIPVPSKTSGKVKRQPVQAQRKAKSLRKQKRSR